MSRWRQEAPRVRAIPGLRGGILELEILTGEKQMETHPESSKPQLGWSECPPNSLETSQGLLSRLRGPSLCVLASRRESCSGRYSGVWGGVFCLRSPWAPETSSQSLQK